jgi:hypothetical protein
MRPVASSKTEILMQGKNPSSLVVLFIPLHQPLKFKKEIQTLNLFLSQERFPQLTNQFHQKFELHNWKQHFPPL